MNTYILSSCHSGECLYAEDWERYITPEGYGSVRYFHAWTLSLAPYVNVSPADIDGEGYIAPRGQARSAYIYQCPRDVDNTWYGQNIYYGMNYWGLMKWGLEGLSVVMNGEAGKSIRIDDVKLTTVFFGDYQCKGFWNQNCTDLLYPGGNAMGPVHPAGYNYLLGGGNVESVESSADFIWANFED